MGAPSFKWHQAKLQKWRVRIVKNVRETNGEIDFQDALRFQKGAEE